MLNYNNLYNINIDITYLHINCVNNYSDKMKTIEVKSSSSSFKVKHLTPDSNYKFKLITIGYNKSVVSTEIFLRTLPANGFNNILSYLIFQLFI